MTSFLEYLVRWPLVPPLSLTPIPRSENLVFRLRDGQGGRFILRLHRPGYHTLAEVMSELNWIAALRHDTGLQVPEVVPARDGSPVLPLPVAGETSPRLAVLFVENPGVLPNENDPDLPGLFSALGAAAALCHLHAASWVRPVGFARPDWTIATTLGANGIWGDWKAAPGLSDADLVVLAKTEMRLMKLFDAYGTASDRFGLIHNDMRPSNFLWHDKRLRLIDFDDCGFSWFIADFAASVSWFEADPRVPDLFRRWLEGYRRHRALSDADIAMAGPAVMARRLLLLAWSASRAETDLAAAHAKGFAEGTVKLARKFLDGVGLV
ncbi:MAG: phosphotransferase [Alphaproteobacteria bacterium]|nr:phosphotransferase [Alphaproteobacteria bacterium]